MLYTTQKTGIYGGGLGNEAGLGASNSLIAGGNFMGGQGSAINPDAFKKDARQQKIYNKGMGTDNPNEREIFLQRTGPQLPLAGLGNMGGMYTQASFGGTPMGNAGFYAGPQLGQMVPPPGFQGKSLS